VFPFWALTLTWREKKFFRVRQSSEIENHISLFICFRLAAVSQTLYAFPWHLSFFFYLHQVEEAIETKELPAYLEKSNLQIADLVQLVRTDLQAGVRIAVEALIVLDVHGEWGS